MQAAERRCRKRGHETTTGMHHSTLVTKLDCAKRNSSFRIGGRDTVGFPSLANMQASSR